MQYDCAISYITGHVYSDILIYNAYNKVVLWLVSIQKVKEFTIPVGHQACVSPTVNHNLKEAWKDPEIFNPDRYKVLLTNNITLNQKPYCMYMQQQH